MRASPASGRAGPLGWVGVLIVLAAGTSPVGPFPCRAAIDEGHAPPGVAAGTAPEDDGDKEGDAGQPGLVAVYRSLAAGGNGASLTRIDLKPAFTLGRFSPHPRLAAGRFEVTWEGTLQQQADDPVRFGAYLCGDLTVSLDGAEFLRGRGPTETSWVESAGFARLPRAAPAADHLSVARGGRCRLQLWWEGRTFPREPLPAWRLKHGPADRPATLVREESSGGRSAAESFGCARCHPGSLPTAAAAPPPGPSLTGAGRRLSRGWMLNWLEDPSRARDGRGCRRCSPRTARASWSDGSSPSPSATPGRDTRYRPPRGVATRSSGRRPSSAWVAPRVTASRTWRRTGGPIPTSTRSWA